LSPAERDEIITVGKQEEYADIPPTQIVPKLADKGIYLASEIPAEISLHKAFYHSSNPFNRI